MKLKFVAAAVVALSALSSQAATYDWGVHDPLEVSGVVPVTASLFLDKYTFTLASTTTLTSSISALGIAPGTYGIFNADNTATAFSWNYGANPGATHVATLGAGTYYYSVFGATNGVGVYSLSSAAVAAPVPEPETYALLGAGLGIIGFVASRRRRND